jgi:hypothetical protein
MAFQAWDGILKSRRTPLALSRRKRSLPFMTKKSRTQTYHQINSEKFEITTDIILVDVVKYSLLANEEQLCTVEMIQFDLTKQIYFMAELTNLRTIFKLSSEVVCQMIMRHRIEREWI